MTREADTTPVESVVQLTYRGRQYTFRVDRRPPLAFWRVEVDGHAPYLSPLRAVGDEAPSFFLVLAEHVSAILNL